MPTCDVLESVGETTHEGSVSWETVVRGVNEPGTGATFRLAAASQDLEVDDVVRDKNPSFTESGFEHGVAVEGSNVGLAATA